MILTLDKPPGWTPLEAMEAYRAAHPTLAGEAMVYAGRLDPMAEGVLLVLTGADRFALPEHLAHDKEYIATILFGVESDTHDALGHLRWSDAPTPVSALCADAVAGLTGAHTLPLPAWSAYRVRGRPLHAWAKENRLHEIDIPKREMRVLGVSDVTVQSVRPATLFDDAVARITRVRGDFRQAEALEDWRQLSAANPPFALVTATITVTSGTYLRALAHALGTHLGTGALLFALRRTRVGPYTNDGYQQEYSSVML